MGEEFRFERDLAYASQLLATDSNSNVYVSTENYLVVCDYLYCATMHSTDLQEIYDFNNVQAISSGPDDDIYLLSWPKTSTVAGHHLHRCSPGNVCPKCSPDKVAPMLTCSLISEIVMPDQTRLYDHAFSAGEQGEVYFVE